MNFREFHKNNKKFMKISEKYLGVTDPNQKLDKAYVYVSNDQIAHDYSSYIRMFIDDFRSLFNQAQQKGIEKRYDLAFQFMLYMDASFKSSDYLKPQKIRVVEGFVKVDKIPNENDIYDGIEQLEFDFNGDGPKDMIPHTWVKFGDSIIDFSGPQRFIKTGLIKKLSPDKYYEN